jgi:hypothetical protein
VANDKNYHMILTIIIILRGRNVLQRTLGSGWGVLIPGVLLAVLGFADLSVDIWRGLVILGMLMSAMMIWHHQLRHFILLPSCVALVSGMMLIIMNCKLMG